MVLMVTGTFIVFGNGTLLMWLLGNSIASLFYRESRYPMRDLLSTQLNRLSIMIRLLAPNLVQNERRNLDVSYKDVKVFVYENFHRLFKK